MSMDQDRLVELEIKLAYQEDLLQTLNTVVAQQQRQITALENAYRFLHDKVNQIHLEKGQEIVDEIPPHY
jgi:SlyX protein